MNQYTPLDLLGELVTEILLEANIEAYWLPEEGSIIFGLEAPDLVRIISVIYKDNRFTIMSYQSEFEHNINDPALKDKIRDYLLKTVKFEGADPWDWSQTFYEKRSIYNC